MKFDGYDFTEIEIKNMDSYEEYVRHLGCDWMDITTRTINGKVYDVVVDDEGLLKENPQVTAVTTELKPSLVGNLIFTNFDAIEGRSLPLTDDDVESIKQSAVFVFSVDEQNVHAMKRIIIFD